MIKSLFSTDPFSQKRFFQVNGVFSFLFPVMMLYGLLTGFLMASELTYEQGQNAYDSGDYKQAQAIWKQVAGTGDQSSMFALGTLMLEGPGDIQVDHLASAAWFEKAAELGHPHSQYNLGNAYQKGLGVTQDDEKAVYWWQRASDQGMPNAAYNLGVQYMYGRGVQQDYQQALNMFRFAAARGHTSARKLLQAWGFEIPELAGTDAADADRLASTVVMGKPALKPAVAKPPESDVAKRTAAELPKPVTGSTISAPAVSAESGLAGIKETTEHEPNAQTAQTDDKAASQDAVIAMPQESPNLETAVASEETKENLSERVQPDPHHTSVPRESTVSAIPSSFTAEKSGILELPGNHYTLQLTAMSKQHLVDEFILQFKLTGDLHFYQYEKGRNTYFALSIGTFSTREDALAFRDQLAARNMKGWQPPWLRRFSDIQELIRVTNP